MSGVISRGVRAPIIREGDDIVKLTADAVEAAMAEEGFELHERDIVAVTESVVARSDGNYASRGRHRRRRAREARRRAPSA